MGKVKAHELRGVEDEKLLHQLDDLRNELKELRVSKVSGQGGPSKLSKIAVVRKSIARVLTVYNNSRRTELRKQYKGKTFKPLDLRCKKTRAIRRALTVKQKSKLTTRQQKIQQNFGQRKFALRAQ